MKMLPELSNSKSREFWHLSLSHLTGVVYLNYCSIAGHIVWHYMHLKLPSCSSGLTSVVRVTVPEIDMILPRLIVFKSLILLIDGRL